RRLALLTFGPLTAFPFALRALQLWLLGLCGRRLRFPALGYALGIVLRVVLGFVLGFVLAVTLTLGVASGVRTGFAFRSSGLPRFSGLWFCDQLDNTLDFVELGRRGQDR